MFVGWHLWPGFHPAALTVRSPSLALEFARRLVHCLEQWYRLGSRPSHAHACATSSAQERLLHISFADPSPAESRGRPPLLAGAFGALENDVTHDGRPTTATAHASLERRPGRARAACSWVQSCTRSSESGPRLGHADIARSWARRRPPCPSSTSPCLPAPVAPTPSRCWRPPPVTSASPGS